MPPPLNGHTPALRLDVDSQRVWCGEREINLTPKCYGVLRHLMENAQKLIAKEALLKAVWPRSKVEPAQVTQFVAELRRLLNDHSNAPCYIETVHGRGYRFIGPVVMGALPGPVAAHSNTRPARSNSQGSDALVEGNRARELNWLTDRFELALHETTQLCLITGPEGMGRSTLVRVFIERLRSHPDATVLRGQCVETLRNAEPMLPVLTALEALLDAPQGSSVMEQIRRHAPQWLLQYPGRISIAELESLSRLHQGTAGNRMLREFARLLDALAVDRPVVLWLDDLHCADDSCIELIAHLTRQVRSRRVLIIGTSLPLATLAPQDALRRLVATLNCGGAPVEMALQPLRKDDVRAYLQWQLSEEAKTVQIPDEDLVDLVHRRSGGHPLLMMHEGRHARRQDDGRSWLLAQSGRSIDCEKFQPCPDDLRSFIEGLMGRLSEDAQQLLIAASCAETRFHAHSLAGALGWSPHQVEIHFDQLTRDQTWLHCQGGSISPDGLYYGEYTFLYPSLREALRARVPPHKRTHLQALMRNGPRHPVRRREDKVFASVSLAPMDEHVKSFNSSRN